jgi:REP element-mobilizing transposase RayT
MARKVRLEYAGAIYHVMSRGDRREAIFRDDADREGFLNTLGEACEKAGWEVHALCLMGNHFHLVVETPGGNLVTGMKWLLGTYTMRFNRRHRLTGHLFAGRYKALVVDGGGTGYFRTVCEYVHLNPARAGLLAVHERLAGYRWSSWPEYLKAPKSRWKWLRVDRLLGECGILKDSPAGRRALERAVEARRLDAASTDYAAIRRGWCFGEEAFRKELLAQIAERVGPEHFGGERVEAAEAKAERLIREELRRLQWTEADLEQRAKGDRIKVAIAARLRADTLVSVKWIAARLHMGTGGYVNNRLYRWRKGLME